MLYDEYGTALLGALDAAPTLKDQMTAWLEVAREHHGVVRASQELMRVGSPHLLPAKELRSACADLIAKRLGSPRVDTSALRGASLMVTDIIAQYALTEAVGWIQHKDPERVATQIELLVLHGLYSA